MGNLSEKQLFLVLIVVVGLVAVAFGVLAFIDYQRIQDNYEQMDQVKKESTDLHAKIVKIPALSRAVEELRKRFDENIDKVPDKEYQPELLKGIKYQASNAEVEMLSYDIRADAAASYRRGPAVKPWKEINIAIRVQGGFHQLHNFLTRLEHYNRILSVKNGKLRPSGTGDKRDILEFTANLVAFVQPAKMEGIETQGRFWQSVEIPPGPQLDPRITDPFRMKLTERPTVGPEGQQPVGPTSDKEAEKIIEDLKAKVNKIQVMFKTNADPREILKEWEELDRTVNVQNFTAPKYRNELTKIKDQVKALEKPVRELYMNMIIKLTKDVAKVIDSQINQGEYREACRVFVNLMKDFKGINIPIMIRTDIEEMGGKFLDCLQKFIDLSDPKNVILAVDELEAALKLTIMITETETILTKAKEYREKGKAIEEFNSFEILVSGIIWTPDSGKRIAIVNGKGYLEGEAINIVAKDQKPRDVRLFSVSRNKYVHFTFKELNIRVNLGKRDTSNK